MSEAAPILSVEALNRATVAAEDLACVLRSLERTASANPYPKLRRFRLLCIDLFGLTSDGIGLDPVLRVAFAAVRGVENGHIGRRQIRQRIDEGPPGLSPEDRAFAAGLAMGFMTEFLPRERG